MKITMSEIAAGMLGALVVVGLALIAVEIAWRIQERKVNRVLSRIVTLD